MLAPSFVEAIIVITVVLVTLVGLLFIKFRPRPVPGAYLPQPFHPVFGHLPLISKNFHRLWDWKKDMTQEALKNGFKAYQWILPGKQTTIECIDPADVKYMLKDNFPNFVKGEMFQANFKEILGRGIFVTDGAEWKVKRKVASHMFSTSNLKSKMFQAFASHAVSLSDRLASLAKSGEEIDVQNLMNRFTMDSICEIAFGKVIDTVSSDKHLKFAWAFDKSQEICAKRFLTGMPLWLRKLLRVKDEVTMVETVKIQREFVYEIIRERRAMSSAEIEKQNDLLSLFLQYGEKNQIEYDDEDLFSVIMNFLIAGRDTTANLLTWFFFNMSKYPDISAKVQEEMDSVIGKSEITVDIINKLPYLQAVMNEVLRLFPPVPADGKYVVNKCTLPNGITMQPKWGLGYSPYALNRLEKVWGKDATEFRPERWLERDHEPTQFEFPTFNAGPRLCLGKHMAYMEAKIVACLVLRSYNIVVPKDYEPRTEVAIILRMTDGLPATVKRR